jgi:hypothetical protein
VAEETKKAKDAETVKRPTGKGGSSKKSAAPAIDPRDLGDEPTALMTTTLKVMDWASKRRRQITITLGALAAAGAIWGGVTYYRMTRELSASQALAKGVIAELSPIKTGEEEADVLKRIQFFTTDDERQKAALAAYADTKAKYGDTGAGVLARLGEAGVFLDRREWDSAIAAYTDVRNHPLAQADANVRLRCIEGLGYAREGKGAVDEARKSFDELMNMDAKGAKPLGLYHLARLDAAQGKNAEAITKLKSARDAISQPGAPSARYLKENIEKLLGRLDPSSVHKEPRFGGAGGMPNIQGLPPGITPDQLKALLGGKGGLPPGLPAPPPGK